MEHTRINLSRQFFTESSREIVRDAGISAELFRYDSGIEAIRLRNRRGHLVILPYYGQMIWQAMFDGVDLALASMFRTPQPANDIVGTYGCFMYHSGLLRNGNPGPRDSHALHGEMPLAPMNRAWLEVGKDKDGSWLAIVSEREYLMGFGDHYIARPRVVMRPDDARFTISMQVENCGVDAMDLMYMCHANFAFVDGGRIIQPTSFGKEDTVIRSSVPAIVKSSDAYLQRLAHLKEDPSSTEVIDATQELDPELVFYLKHLRPSSDGLNHVMMRRPAGDAFSVTYDPSEFSHLVRWILANNKQRVCAFAMPATCGVEGHASESEHGNVRTLPGGQQTSFSIRLGYLNASDATQEEALIRNA